MKYGVVGSQVNLTSRIQSYTTGGQVLISEATRQDVGRILKPGKQMEIKAKGIEHPITLYEALGIGGSYKLLLAENVERLVPLKEEIPLTYEMLDSSQVSGKMSKGGLTKVSCKAAEARLETPVPDLSNLKMRLIDREGKEIPGTLYGKVLGAAHGSSARFSIRFTSVSPEIETLLASLTAKVAPTEEAEVAGSGPS
jgi:adenylate cyclase